MKNNSKFVAEKIRSEYVARESDKIEELKALDSKVKRPVNVFSYALGSVGAIVMGAGMSLVMTEIGATLGITAAMPVGIAIGVVGLVIALVNYPLHKKLLAGRREKFADEIIKLSESIINE